MRKIVSLLGFIFITMVQVTAQPTDVIKSSDNFSGFCLSQDEMILYNLVNDLRKQNKLSVIPLSKSLSIVSKVHIDDLLTWKPQEKGCSLHSWSSNGKWSACCNGKDPMGTKCMNTKPGEITGYTGTGYELVYWEEETATPTEAFDLWQQVEASKEMILNRGKWQSRSWKAMGVGIKACYAVIWLGDKPDKAANIHICGSDTLVQMARGTTTPVAPMNTVSGKKTGNEEVSTAVKEEVNVPAIYAKENRLFIIVASLKSESLAQVKANELINKGYQDAIVVISSDKFRVSIGSYPTETKAKARIKELKQSFPDCWLLRY